MQGRNGLKSFINMTIVIAIAALGSLTLILALMLVLANKKHYDYEDPRREVMEDLLPQDN